MGNSKKIVTLINKLVTMTLRQNPIANVYLGNHKHYPRGLHYKHYQFRGNSKNWDSKINYSTLKKTKTDS